MTDTPLDRTLQGYLVAALWTATDDSGEPLDQTYTVADFSPEAIAEARKDVGNFIAEADDLLDGLDPEQVGHDFSLTRNGHGAGFWDRGLGERGETLTAMCKPYGEEYVYVVGDRLEFS